jgi:poly(beta-D-mannuronate) lyase
VIPQIGKHQQINIKKIFILKVKLFIATTYLVFISLMLKAADLVVDNVADFNKAITSIQPGGTIVWKNGTYSNIVIVFSPLNTGKSTMPITLKAQSPGQVIFNGNSQISIGGNYLYVEGFLFKGNCTLSKGQHVIDFQTKKPAITANFCKVSNCAVIDYTPTEESDVTNYYINLLGTNNEVDHCYFSGKVNKGPTLVVEYKQDDGYVPGSETAPSTYHHIHHNYFGYRTFSSNGGEQMRIGTSTTSLSKGFNIIEYNVIEDERIEAEAISNKSCDNIYRYNSLLGNDGGLVIRHGSRCFVYNNYINGKSGRNESAGIRVINPNNTVFNNYVENIESSKGMKGALVIMAGLQGSEINGYYPADHALVAYNTIVNVVGPAIKIGVGNTNKGKALTYPKNVLLANNAVIGTVGSNNYPLEVADTACTYTCKNNVYTNGENEYAEFSVISISTIKQIDGFKYSQPIIDENIITAINNKLKAHNISLTIKDITQFNTAAIATKSNVGVSWIKL